MIDRLLLEKTSLAGIARVLTLSQSGLQQYVKDGYDKVLRSVQVTAKPKASLLLCLLTKN
ncbi:hypothetical protein H6F93_31830 [Leptolyngbya sp. FACHB-671]|uniref:hypothetical protein n=1 Tax=Leptolyngbya sp. FACHB-671 TaxID=2692812 RepID=UPI0016861CB6|nr:hypothetical protein [Leptolyngbya sp. FACHB-671]MBD2072060.1 hypothetical protein [Leptolyngbya sp. FACHB-671]